MKIAIPYEGGLVFQHFGHAPAFKLYTVEGGEILESQEYPTAGTGHGALAGFLQAFGADALVCGGIGGGARAALAQAGIAVFGGVTGDADEAALALAQACFPLTPRPGAAIMTAATIPAAELAGAEYDRKQAAGAVCHVF